MSLVFKGASLQISSFTGIQPPTAYCKFRPSQKVNSQLEYCAEESPWQGTTALLNQYQSVILMIKRKQTYSLHIITLVSFHHPPGALLSSTGLKQGMATYWEL